MDNTLNTVDSDTNTSSRRDPRWASFRWERSISTPLVEDVEDGLPLPGQQPMKTLFRTGACINKTCSAVTTSTPPPSPVGVQPQHPTGTPRRPPLFSGMIDQIQQAGLDLCVDSRPGPGRRSAPRLFSPVKMQLHCLFGDRLPQPGDLSLSVLQSHLLRCLARPTRPRGCQPGPTHPASPFSRSR